MYQWISSEIWLILGLISLMAYLTKGIDYKENILSKRNKIICWLIGISMFQVTLSIIEIYNVFIEYYIYIYTAFIIYGGLFICYLLISGKLSVVDKVALAIFFIGALMICYIKTFLQ